MIKQRYRILIVLILITTALVLLFPHLRGLTVQDVIDFAPQPLPLTILVFVLLYLSKAFVVVPPLTVYYAAAGIVFPAGVAIITTYLGLCVLLSTGYIIGKVLGREKVYSILSKNPRLKKYFDTNQNRLLVVCFVVRIFPVNDILNLLFGALNLPYWKYLLVSLLGLTPYMILVVLTGEAVSNPLSPQFLIPLVLSIAVLIFGYVMYKRQPK